MKKKSNVKKILVIFLFIISFFIWGKVNAENIALPQIKDYSKFDWDDFYEENKDYWNYQCRGECDKRYLKYQKKFYERLYKILHIYQDCNPSLYIDDRVITETIFFEITPGEAAASLNDYNEHWNVSPAYKYDDTTTDIDNDGSGSYGSKIDLDTDSDMDNYYEEERDTLKTLINNALSIEGNCYYIYGDPTVKKLADGTEEEVCIVNGEESQEVSVYQIASRTRKCATKISSVKHAYYEYFLTSYYDIKKRIFKYVPGNTLSLIILGLIYEPKDYKDCEDAADGTHETRFSYYGNEFEVDYNKYWTFLAHNAYFDNKKHLQSYYQSLFDKIKREKNIKVDCMKSNQCRNSVEESGLYDEYEEDIIKSREKIIYSIMSILRGYLKDDYTNEELAVILNYGSFAENFIEAGRTETSRKSYFWPIGSDQTEERDGRIFADGEPASTDVVSKSGKRFNEALGEYEEHYGIDIAGKDGVTNVISVYDGEVYSITNNCTVGDYTCNEGYGNQIIISHPNGDYTVFAHLSDVLVSVGQSVLKGQFIGHVGSTGATLKSVLHYEIRSGTPSVKNSQDVLSYQDPTMPRPVGVSGDFSAHYTNLTKEEFVSKMNNYCSTIANAKFKNAFCSHVEELYDASISNGVNPEFVVVRAISEGFSPGGSTYNYWGIGCTNSGKGKNCRSYSSLTDGIRGLANLGIVKNNDMVSDVMAKYAYIGAYWFNPGSWPSGGCPYFPYIKKYLSSSRISQVESACLGPACTGDACLKTTEEDQAAYKSWQVEKMAVNRYNVFTL